MKVRTLLDVTEALTTCRRPLLASTILLSAVLFGAACGDDGQPAEDPGPIEASPKTPLALSSTTSCSLDSDCAAGRYCFAGHCASECQQDSECPDGQKCTPRGQCLQGSEDDSQPPVSEGAIEPFDNLEVVQTPETDFRVAAGQSEVTVRLHLSGPAPDSGVPYRIERADDTASSAQIRRAAGGQDVLEVDVPVGQADPEADDSKSVRATLVTPMGEFNLSLYPAAPVSGTYAGRARLHTFGATGLPLQLQVVTEPNGAPLQDAQQVWLVLPVGPQYLFSPARGSDASDYVARPLEYNDRLERWVATFRNGFDLSDGDVITKADPAEVRRSFRFELQQFDAETLIGDFNDRWSGLYEPTTSRGVTSPEDIIFEGEFEVTRNGPSREYQDLQTTPLASADPEGLADPPIDRCGDDAMFEFEANPDDPDTPAKCGSIASADQFGDASPADQASCALAVADSVLQGDTTIATVEAYLNGDDVDTGDSFEEFITKCADDTDPTCKASEDVMCARQLVAHAYDRQGQNSTQLGELVDRYNSVTREAFFGQQVAAFGADTSLRLDWLSATAWPGTFASLKDIVAETLETWKTQVLEAHLETLRGQFDPSGLAVMSRQVAQADAADAREQLLSGMTQNWRGSVDALTLATQRWNQLFTADAPRAEKTAYVSARMFDLYLSAGLLRNLNTSANAGYLSARLAGGFDILLDEVGKLSLPFSDLIYARDGEVVVSTSLDPEETNDTLIGNRRQLALDQVAEAQSEVTDVLAKSRAEALNREQLANEMDNQIDDARTRLVNLCGRPVGCEGVNYLSEPPEGCQVRVEAGQCGFQIDRDTDEIDGFTPGQQNVSEAGRVLLDLAEAAKQVSIADADRSAQLARIQLRWEELQSFEADIEARNDQRTAYVDQLRANIDERRGERNQELQELDDSLEQRADIQQQRIDTANSNFEHWEQISSEGASERLGYAISELSLNQTARASSATADEIDRQAEAVVDGMPIVVGTSADPSFAARLATSLAANGAISGLKAAATAAEATAEGLAYKRERLQAAEDTTLTNMEHDYEIQKTEWTAQIAKLKRQAQKKSAETDSQVANLEDAAELLRQQLEAELAYSRDLSEFDRRRSEIVQMITKNWGLKLRKEQAKLQVKQVIARYLDVVQRAHIGQAELQKFVAQSTDVNALVGSPGVLFARANELKAAERDLIGAKQKLMNWLVALEYFAVRPFVDQRQEILLARNPYELEKIADQLDQLQRTCGGATSDVTTTLSVRKDLLGIDKSVVDSVNTETITPVERFRRLLERGYVPTDKRVRYSTDENLGGLMARNPDILSGTFFIDLTDFANLQLTCNAKVKSVAINLVGEGLGQANPTVTVLYDGTSKLRSCQPGIADYIDLIGETATTYGPISRFSAAGRSMSPVASVNGFGETNQSASTTLSGLPLASQYTLLVDKSAGENATIDWSALEDIEFRLTYSYQDVFPVGQCEL